MSHIQIDDTTPIISYTVGVSPRSNFPVPFAYFEASELVVTSDGVAINPLDYTVTGTAVDDGFSSGQVDLDVAVTSVTIVIERILPIERVTDFPNSGPLDIRALNTQFDKNTAIDQQLDADIAALRVSFLAVLAGLPAPITFAAEDLSNGVVGTGAVVLESELRERLSTNLTVYVRTDGSDANDGRTNTAGGAKLTIQAAWNVLAALDTNGHSVTIQVADGTYTGGLSVAAPIFGAASIAITGNTVTPANCFINCTNANCLLFDSIPQLVTIGGFKLATTTAGDCLIVRNNANVRFTGLMTFGASAGAHMTIDGGAFASGVNYTVSGSCAGAHMHVINWGNVGIDGINITLTGVPAWGTYFAGIASGIVTCVGTTFTGTATGIKYVVHGEGYFKTNGAALPGSLPGSAVGGNLNDNTGPITVLEEAAAVTIDATTSDPTLYFNRIGVRSSFISDLAGSILVSSNLNGSAGMFIIHGASAWSAVSDARLPYKRTARDITDALPSLEGFRLYENEIDGRLEMFVKAQEFHAVAPHMVTIGSDDPEYVPTGPSDPGAWAVSYERAGMLALAYIKQQAEMIEKLQARLAALEAR